MTHRHGAEDAAESGAAAAGPHSVALARVTARAVALYEAFADRRPPGWPPAGPAALCALASQRRVAVIAGDVARLQILAKGMRATALLCDEQRIVSAVAGARRRRPAADARVAFRTGAPRWESAEQRRIRVRDRLLLAGADPAAWPSAALAIHAPELGGRDQVQPELIGPDAHAELDGIGARAERYRIDLANGRWAIPPGGPITPTQPNRRTPAHEPARTRAPADKPGASRANGEHPRICADAQLPGRATRHRCNRRGGVAHTRARRRGSGHVEERAGAGALLHSWPAADLRLPDRKQRVRVRRRSRMSHKPKRRPTCTQAPVRAAEHMRIRASARLCVCSSAYVVAPDLRGEERS